MSIWPASPGSPTPPTATASAGGTWSAASGTGSRVELPLLASLEDRNGGYIDASSGRVGYSVVEASAGGAIDAPHLTTLAFTDLSIAGGDSVLPIDQLTSVTDGSITVSGAGNDRAFTNLTNITGSDITSNGATTTLPAVTQADGASLYAKGGGLLSLPGLAAYAMVRGGTATLGADGAGSAGPLGLWPP